MIKKNGKLSETGIPMVAANENPKVLNEKETEDMILAVETHLQKAIEALAIDTTADPNTNETAHRIAKMWVRECFKGRYTNPPKVTSFPNTQKINQILFIGPITVKSTCSHHFVPFIGKGYIAVLPDEDSNVIGLSKYARMLDWFARRPQIQEELTVQIANYIERELKPKGLAILLNCQHYCCYWRGVEDPTMKFTTSDLRGAFLDNLDVRNEFYKLVDLNERK